MPGIGSRLWPDRGGDVGPPLVADGLVPASRSGALLWRGVSLGSTGLGLVGEAFEAGVVRQVAVAALAVGGGELHGLPSVECGGEALQERRKALVHLLLPVAVLVGCACQHDDGFGERVDGGDDLGVAGVRRQEGLLWLAHGWASRRKGTEKGVRGKYGGYSLLFPDRQPSQCAGADDTLFVG
jgi:hypothetical protein